MATIIDDLLSVMSVLKQVCTIVQGSMQLAQREVVSAMAGDSAERPEGTTLRSEEGEPVPRSQYRQRVRELAIQKAEAGLAQVLGAAASCTRARPVTMRQLAEAAIDSYWGFGAPIRDEPDGRSTAG